MKNFFNLMLVMIILASSCQRSQFSTTTRQYKNGKVSYLNTHYREHRKTLKGKFHKNHLTVPDEQYSISTVSGTEQQSNGQSLNTEINPVHVLDYENLIASTSIDPEIIRMDQDHSGSTENLILSCYNQPGILKDNGLPDTIKSFAPQQGTTMDFSEENVIRLKKGRKISTGFIYQSHDTLFYKSTSNTKITNFVTGEQVDTIFKVKYYDSMRSQVVDTRIPDKQGLSGLILSFIGFIPIIGLPFAVAAVILGAISIRKINRHPEKYSGTGKAYGSVVLGILGAALSAILLIAMAISGGPGSTGLGMGQ
jgi:hypothetical protein